MNDLQIRLEDFNQGFGTWLGHNIPPRLGVPVQLIFKIKKVLLIDIIAFAKRIMDREHKITLNKWFVLVTYKLGSVSWRALFAGWWRPRLLSWTLEPIYRLPLLFVKLSIYFLEITVLFISSGDPRTIPKSILHTFVRFLYPWYSAVSIFL